MTKHMLNHGRLLALAAIMAIGTMAGCGNPQAGAGAETAQGDDASVWTNSAAYLGTSAGDPAIASWRAGRLDAFYRGSDNTLRHKSWNFGDPAWSAEENLGSPSATNTLTSDPAVVSWGDNRIDIFARDTNGQLVHKWWAGGWSGWELNMGAIGNKPAVASQANGSLDVFARNSSNQLITRSYRPASGWSGWGVIGGVLYSDPAAVSWSNNRLDVFAQNGSAHLQHWWWAGGAWSAAEDLGGSVYGTPAVSSWGTNRLDIFARNSSNQLSHLAWVPGWTTWETLTAAGTLTGGPGAVSWGPNRIDILTRDAYGNMYRYTWIDTLGVPLIPQQQTNWCWAASAQMIAKSLGLDIKQCEEANHYFGRTNCCTDAAAASDTSGCNDKNGGWPEFSAWGMSSSMVDNGGLTLDQVKDQVVTKGKPFAFSWKWTGTGGHMMVAVDYLRFDNQDWIAVNDPWAPNVGTRSLITYSRFLKDTDHTHWRDYYDVAVQENRGDAMTSLSLGDRFSAPARWSDWFCIPGEQCELGDVNGDGKKDVISFDHNGNVYVALSTGSGFSGYGWKWHTSFCYGSETCKVGDFNGDGKDDILVFNNSGSVYVALSNGNGFGPVQLWQSAFCYTGEVCDVGDFNGDKQADVLVLQSSGNAWVSLSNGAAFNGINRWTTTFSYCFNGQQCKVGDVNGDGKADLIGFTMGSTNDVYVATSNGGGFGAASKWNDYFGVNGEVLGVGDIDGDGMADIVTVSRAYGVYAALSTGSSFNGVGWRWGVGIGGTADEIRVGDVNGDGRADIVTFFR
jgi:hypothetical protein